MTAPPADLLAGLNPEQRRAAEAVHGPVRILAGAGTGKTRTVTHRIAHQIATGVVRADQVLAVTFTERAAAELRSRLAALGIDRPVRAATFHSAAWAQLRHFWRPVAEAVDADPSRLPDVLASKLPLLAGPAHRLGVEPMDLAGEIEWAKNRALTPEQVAASGRAELLSPTQLAEALAAYEAAKRQRGAIDYEDMLLLGRRLMDLDEPAAAVRDRYRAFTVDEFQDVNPAQWALLRAWLGDRDEVCVVGDDDQTIFSFTGADAGYLTGFQRHYPHATTVALTRNYRSTPQVLATANRVLWSRGRRRQLTAATPATGPDPVFVEHATDQDEVRVVVTAVRTLLDGGVDPAEVAICYRTNAQSAAWEDALRQAGIPTVVRGDQAFFARAEVRQALAALRAAVDAPPELPRAATPPPPGVAPEDPSVVEVAEQVLRQRLSWHPSRPPDGAAARDRWEHVGAVLGLVEQLAASRPELPYAEVVADLDRRAAGGADHRHAAVTLMSLHRAKGTEFDAVFLVGLEEGLVPIGYASTDEELAEERRLLYVGITRARRWLWLSWARSRSLRGRPPVNRQPSRFLYGLGPGAPVSAKTRRQQGQGGTDRRRRTARRDAEGPTAERLRAWRRQRAQDDGVPAYVVFSDATLAELAERKPSDADELLRVPGMGRKRVDRYGDDVLEVLAGG